MEIKTRTIIILFAFSLIAVSIAMPSILYFKYSKAGEPADSYASASISLRVVGANCGDGYCNESAGEDCVSCPEDCGECVVVTTGGSGGGGGRSTVLGFRFIPGYIEENLYPGESLVKEVELENTGNKDLEIDLSIIDLRSLIFIDKDRYDLKGGEKEKFEVLISVSDSADPTVYLGEIMGEAGDLVEELPIVLRVEQRGAPIVVDINIPEDNRAIRPGDIVQGEVNILNNLSESIEVSVEYIIQNKEENIEFSEKNVLSLKPGNNFFVEEYESRVDMEDGYYLYYARVHYEGEDYADAASFKVESNLEVPGLFFGSYIIYGFLLFFVLILLVLFYLFVAKRRKKKEKKKAVEEKMPMDYQKLVGSTISKLHLLKLEAKKGYSAGLIDKYFMIIRSFFTKYYSVSSGLTFEELEAYFGKKNIKKTAGVISFLKKIEHIPYHKGLISKSEFDQIIEESIKIVGSHKPRKKADEKKVIKGKKEKSAFKKKKRKK
jgi:hypothetical protein